MNTAKDARWMSCRKQDHDKLWEIHKKIEESAKNNTRYATVDGALPELIWDILKLDYGYTLKTTFGYKNEQSTIILW